VGLVLGVRRAGGLVAIGVVFIAAHSAIAHKELRFILPVLPVLFAAAAVGFSQLELGRQRVLLTAVALAAVVSALGHRGLTFGDIGAYPERAKSSAWDDFGPVNRLMKVASARPDLCGLRIDAAHLAWTGGSSYLHRRAPLYMPGTSAQEGHFNYAILRPGSGAEVVATQGGLELVHLPLAQCVPDERYTWQLP
jgi:phosphatidylinositol glycan class B